MPTGRVIAIRGKRIRRKLGYRGRFLILERARPDRPEPRPRKQRTPAPVTVREALRLFWEVDRYPILGNEDLRASITNGKRSARARRDSKGIAGRSGGIRAVAGGALFGATQLR